MINFDNSLFFRKNGFDFKNDKNYIENLSQAQHHSEKILEEFSSGNNQILQSFTAKYQKKIRNIKQSLKLKSKKKSSNRNWRFIIWCKGIILFFK